MEITDTRIAKLREYLFKIIDNLTLNQKYQINADFLGTVGDFSLDKIPTQKEIEPSWITGTKIKKDIYSFKSRKYYSSDTINNLSNIGFFEEFENTINSNNEEGILPEIENIESIECLNSGSLVYIDETQATFDIQIQITYLDDGKGKIISL